MAINRFNDYNETKAYGQAQVLPKGGYVLKIMGAEVCQNHNGQYVKISCDIAEGEFKDFYANDYRAQQSEDKKWRCNYLLNVPKDDGTEQDGWTKRKFKTVIEAMEESNSGYRFDWDEKKFKGKLIGGLFNEREYEANGSVKKAINLAQLCTVESIRNNTYKLPVDKLLGTRNNTAFAPATNNSPEGFMNIPNDIDTELPFN